MKPKIVGIGIAVLDYIFQMDALPTQGIKYRAKALRVVGGGLAATAAVAASQLGGDVRLIARLGDDIVADTIIRELQDYGVTCDLIRRYPGTQSPVSTIMIDKAGERMIVSYSDSTQPKSPDWLPDNLLDGVKAVHGDTRWQLGAITLFDMARQLGIPSVLDADRGPSMPEVVPAASHVGFSATGLSEFAGESDLQQALLKARQLSPNNWLAVTDGPRGVYYLEGDAIRHVPAFVVDVIDTLGAGDTWHGALALALAEGMDSLTAVRFASAASAIKCTRFGGRAGIPKRDEVMAFLAERGPPAS